MLHVAQQHARRCTMHRTTGKSGACPARRAESARARCGTSRRRTLGPAKIGLGDAASPAAHRGQGSVAPGEALTSAANCRGASRWVNHSAIAPRAGHADRRRDRRLRHVERRGIFDGGNRSPVDARVGLLRRFDQIATVGLREVALDGGCLRGDRLAGDSSTASTTGARGCGLRCRAGRWSERRRPGLHATAASAHDTQKRPASTAPSPARRMRRPRATACKSRVP